MPVVQTAPRERGWLRTILALLLALSIPLMPFFGLAVPIEQSIVLIAPAMAVCALVGWLQGGRLWLAAVWLALAGWILATSLPAGGAFQLLSKGWATMLATSFGIVSVVAPRRAFLSRALSATAMTFALALTVIVALRVPPAALAGHVSTELGRRYAESEEEWTRRTTAAEWKEMAEKNPQVVAQFEEFEAKLQGALLTGSTVLFPALLALESLAALGLAWSLFHRASRTRIGAPLRPLSEFRFNDQLVWGVVVGVTLLVLPTLRDVRGLGLNLVAFFGALYALRGLGVLNWFLAPRGLVRVLYIIAIVLAWPVVSVFSLGLGLGDTWIDWRGRVRPAA